MSMIFIDTNYFLRFLLKDNTTQHQTVLKLFRRAAQGSETLCTSTIVLFEVYWVLSSFYKKKKVDLVQILRDICSLPFIVMDERDVLFESLDLYRETTLDLEDCYTIVFAQSIGVTQFASFDKKLLSVYTKRI